MEQEKSEKNLESEATEATSKPIEQEKSEKKLENEITEVSSKPIEQEKSEKNPENEITEVSSKPIEQEKNEKKPENEITQVSSSKPIEQEKNEKKPENEITQVSFSKPIEQDKSEKNPENEISGTSSKPIEQDKSEKKPENEISGSSSKPIEQDNSEKKPDNEITEASSSKPPSSVKQTPKSLKARPKIVKDKMIVKGSPNAVKNPIKVTNSPVVKNSTSSVKRTLTIGKTSPNKNVNAGSNSTPQIQARKNRKRKWGTTQGNKASNCKEIKNHEKLNDKGNERKKVTEQDTNVENLQDQKSDKKPVVSEKGGPSLENKEKQRRSDKNSKQRSKKDRKDRSEKILKHGKSVEKRPQRHQENVRTKEDELGGLIFMCNTKTKPDCFRYRVMGVSMGKKDLVLSIKPGIRLFLYDFDRKLLYGIYKATSSGGMKLEPAAFGGAFPAQVRFDVHQDCYPLPESTFKSAIKENYNERNKFKTELTLQQVRRLLDLFRPAEPNPNGELLNSPQVPRSVRRKEVHEGERASRRTPLRNHERRSNRRVKDEHVLYRTESARREEVPLDSFLSEQEYRTYGLQGHGRSQMPSPYRRSRESDQLLTYPSNGHTRGHSPAVYRETGPSQSEPVLYDPFSLGEKEYETTYGRRREIQPDISRSDSDYYNRAHYSQSYSPSASSYAADPYLQHPIRREDVSSSSYLPSHQRRMSHLTETAHLAVMPDDLEREYLTYNNGDYNLGRVHSQGSMREATFAPVSSRYSFAGPSSIYR